MTSVSGDIGDFQGVHLPEGVEHVEQVVLTAAHVETSLEQFSHPGDSAPYQ